MRISTAESSTVDEKEGSAKKRSKSFHKVQNCHKLDQNENKSPQKKKINRVIDDDKLPEKKEIVYENPSQNSDWESEGSSKDVDEEDEPDLNSLDFIDQIEYIA